MHFNLFLLPKIKFNYLILNLNNFWYLGSFVDEQILQIILNEGEHVYCVLLGWCTYID